MSENPDHNLLIEVLGSQPVKPVKVDRHEKLLVGYSQALKTLSWRFSKRFSSLLHRRILFFWIS